MVRLPSSQQPLWLMPDMTALLDVIFILLVFMMLTASVAPDLLELDLPAASASAQTVEPQAIVLGISERGGFSMGQQVFDQWPEFQAALAQQLAVDQADTDKPQLLIAADKNVEFKHFVQLAAWLAEQGITVTEIVVSDSP